MMLVVEGLSFEDAQRKNYYERGNVGYSISLCHIRVPMTITNIFTDSNVIPKLISH